MLLELGVGSQGHVWGIQLSVHVIAWERSLASVLENVQERVGCSHLASLCVPCHVETCPTSPLDCLLSSVSMWTAFPSADSSWGSVTGGLAPLRQSRAFFVPSCRVVEVACACRSEGSFPPALPSQGRLPNAAMGFVTESLSRARAASSSGAVTMGLQWTNWELGVQQCRFHHAMQVLRDHACCTCSARPALPPCSVPLCLST